MKRRHFLQSAVGLPLAWSASRLWASPSAPGEAKFLLVFLRGGYDAANLLVPYGSEFYYESRPHIAVPRPGSGGDAAIALDGSWALHPALKDSLLPLWQRGQLCFVPFAGTDDLSRSHFETQDRIELGQGERTTDYDDGFLNRLIGQIGAGARPMAFTAQVPLCLRGAVPVPNQTVAQKRGGADMPPRQQELLERMWSEAPQGASVRQGFANRTEVMHEMAALDEHAAKDPGRGAVNPNGFVAEAARIGGLMRARFNVGFIDIGGWDTHVNETGDNGAKGQLADKLGALGDGLAALVQAMGPAWRDTVVAVLSEFGRTFRENGNRGTDHGHGSVCWILGGAVGGGRIAGEQIALSAKTLNQDRDYPVLTDYRDLLGGIFRRQWGLNTAQLQTVFPASEPLELQLL